MLQELDSIYQEFKSSIKVVENENELNDIRVKFLGKNGIVTSEAKKIALVSQDEKKEFGAKVNKLKDYIQKEIQEVKSHIEEKILNEKLKNESIDVTLPGRGYQRGKVHPISHTIDKIKNIFYSMGFQHIDGPDIDNEWNNFTALNIPENHPTRQMHDTFYIEKKSEDKDNLLLRTHTSTVQIRYMLENKPPLKIFSVGKVYRSDYDTTHTPMFHQLECLVVDEKSNVMDLQACLKCFLRLFFDSDQIPMRFRSSYFPFTEPSFEVDVKCDRSKKGEIQIGKGDDWLEILGCGMVNQKVLKNVGIDSSKYQGFAFGVGVERLAMLKYNISDLRSFFEGDIRWLNHYGF
jgi:phenylalanyl-tRNA synthetase alpha chain